MLAKFLLAALALSSCVSAQAQIQTTSALNPLGLTVTATPTAGTTVAPVLTGTTVTTTAQPGQTALTQPLNVFTTLPYYAIINGVPAVVTFGAQAPAGSLKPPPVAGQPCTTTDATGASQTGTYAVTAGLTTCQLPTRSFTAGALCNIAATATAAATTGQYTAGGVCAKLSTACTVVTLGLGQGAPGTYVANAAGVPVCVAAVATGPTGPTIPVTPAAPVVGQVCQVNVGASTAPGTINAAGACVATPVTGSACVVPATATVAAKAGKISAAGVCVANPVPGDACTVAGAAGIVVINSANSQVCVSNALAATTVSAPCVFTGGKAGVVTKVGTAAAKCALFTATATSCATAAKLSALQLTACTAAKFTPK